MLFTLGKRAWYFYGGSSNEERNRMPTYLLQWEAMRWARSQGCDFFDFRNIPEVLEPGQPMYGVYEFKKGFGGFFHRNMPTMELVLNPLIYYPYTWAVDLRHSLRSRDRPQAARVRGEVTASPPEPGGDFAGASAMRLILRAEQPRR